MKSPTSTNIPAFGIALAIFALLAGACTPITAVPVDADRYRLALKTEQVAPRQVKGGNYPAVKPDLKRPLNVGENNKPYYVPMGPE